MQGRGEAGAERVGAGHGLIVARHGRWTGAGPLAGAGGMPLGGPEGGGRNRATGHDGPAARGRSHPTR
ncbi:hypothetical protein SHJG_6358 [Streptomyces hygroscopicus subsp. jinggangensis 5008]|nr:hypothetical protein SHJG_6358 [Streptomyces hygroscopicus subsp. jinggangensis 5008]AGF65782.1 hypothetical protein SHJGH_6119 [Streptomyces hygroscopicus subsp. jinggangensis TL01]